MTDRAGRIAALGVALAVAAVVLVAGMRWLRPPAIRRVILISIDTLRADHLGAYGYARPTSPALDALARRGTVFEHAATASPWTLPSHVSIFTGLYPSHHGMKFFDRSLPKDIPTLAPILDKAGWTTVAAVGSDLFDYRLGFTRGFHHYLYVPTPPSQREPTRRIVDQALDWIRRYRDGRLFAFIHLYDVHSDYKSLPQYEQEFVRPYSGPADGTTDQLLAFRAGDRAFGRADGPHLVDLYDAGVRQVDAEMGRLFDALRAEGLLDDALVLLLSDHGEELFDHGSVLHGRTHFEEVQRVPLFLAGPGIESGRRVAEPVSLVDVLPTLLGLLRLAPPARLDGEDLAPLLAGKTAPQLSSRYLFSEATYPLRPAERAARGLPPRPMTGEDSDCDLTRGVRRGQYKVQMDSVSGRITLYDLATDPREERDLSAERPDLVAAMRGRFERSVRATPFTGDPASMTPEQLERLRSLGYVK